MQRVTVIGPDIRSSTGYSSKKVEKTYLWESGLTQGPFVDSETSLPIGYHNYTHVSGGGKTSVLTPHFATRVAGGELIMNPYFARTVQFDATDMHINAYYRGDSTSGVSPNRLTTRTEVTWDYLSILPAFSWNWPTPITYGASDENYAELRLNLSPSVPSNSAARSRIQTSLETWSRDIGDLAVFNGCDLLHLHQQASIRTLADLRRDSVNVYTSLAEVGKTVDLVGKLMKLLANILFSFKRKILKFVTDPKQLKNILEELASGANPRDLRTEWLRYRYGLRPLLYDLRGYLTILNRHFRYLRTRGHGFAALSAESYSESYWVPVLAANSDVLINYKVNAGARFRGTAIADYDWADPLQSTVFDFGLDRYLQAGWDLIPWSFLVDWFCNVSEWLDALGLGALEPRKKASCMSLKQSFTVEASAISIRKSSETTYTGYMTNMLERAGTARVSVQVVKRFTPGLNIPEFPLLNSNVHLGTFRLIDLVALGSQLRIR